MSLNKNPKSPCIKKKLSAHNSQGKKIHKVKNYACQSKHKRNNKEGKIKKMPLRIKSGFCW